MIFNVSLDSDATASTMQQMKAVLSHALLWKGRALVGLLGCGLLVAGVAAWRSATLTAFKEALFTAFTLPLLVYSAAYANANLHPPVGPPQNSALLRETGSRELEASWPFASSADLDTAVAEGQIQFLLGPGLLFPPRAASGEVQLQPPLAVLRRLPDDAAIAADLCRSCSTNLPALAER